VTGRRGLAGALAAIVLAGAATLLCAGRQWGAATLTASTGARVSAQVTGRDVSEALPALGVLLLVLAVSVVATRGQLRRIAGLVVVAAGGAIVAVAITSRDDVAAALRAKAFAVASPDVHSGLSAWAVVAAVAGVLAVLAGAATAVAGHGWPGLGRRYEAPTPSTALPADREGSTWEALDRGEDPTT